MGADQSIRRLCFSDIEWNHQGFIRLSGELDERQVRSLLGEIEGDLVRVDGEYERGRKRNNPKEAEAVAEQVLAHARKHPGQTLGVVALSVAQRDTIQNKLEFMCTDYPDLEAFCKEGREEAFFVKNIENVQGDERDVIFISICYGRDAGGYMSQNFGPVSSDHGERRLVCLRQPPPNDPEDSRLRRRRLLDLVEAVGGGPVRSGGRESFRQVLKTLRRAGYVLL